MSAACSTILPRSIYSTVEHIRTLIQTVSFTPSSSSSSLLSSSSSLSSPSCSDNLCCCRSYLHLLHGRASDFYSSQSRRRKKRCSDANSRQVVQIDGNNTVTLHHSWTSSHVQQPFGFPVKIRGRFREDYGESEHHKNECNNHHNISSNSFLKKEPSLLLSLIQEIRPLDTSQISKEASSNSRDAMKRTISGMLGLLPSDQFHVTVETSREPLAKLLVSSMMTGYTLRNAEYRLCLHKSLETCNDEVQCWPDEPSMNQDEHFIKREAILENLPREERSFIAEDSLESAYKGVHMIDNDVEALQSLGPISEEARDYIKYLKGKLMSVTKELEDRKGISTGLQVQSMVGDESNDLLDYLRSLAPDKVEELSQPTSQEVEEVIEYVINELLSNPSAKIQQKDLQYGNRAGGNLNDPWDEDNTQKCSSSPLQSQSVLMVNRDHLARLLFWCMLLGNHMRGLEYRLELSRTLSLTGDLDTGINENSLMA